MGGGSHLHVTAPRHVRRPARAGRPSVTVAVIERSHSPADARVLAYPLWLCRPQYVHGKSCRCYSGCVRWHCGAGRCQRWSAVWGGVCYFFSCFDNAQGKLSDRSPRDASRRTINLVSLSLRFLAMFASAMIKRLLFLAKSGTSGS